MGKRGTKPKPDWLKVLDGNPGGRKIKAGIVAPIVDELEPPDYFNPKQIVIWGKVCEMLRSVHALSKTDYIPLVRYVEFLYIYGLASEFMTERSNGNVVYPIKDKNGTTKSIRMLPQLKAMLEVSNHMLKIETQFGLTPSARAGMNLNNGSLASGSADDEIDPFG